MTDFLATIIIFVPAVAGFALVYYIMTKYINRIEQRLRASAQASGAVYYKGPAADDGLTSLLMNTGSGAYIRHSIRYQNDIVLGEADFESRRSIVSFDFATIPFTKYESLWLVVDSRKNNILGRSLMDTADVSKVLESIELEGNFGHTYKVYIKKDQQIAALTALNPASMVKLLDIFNSYDMELCNGQLYIYTLSGNPFYTSEGQQKMMTDITQLAEIL